MRIALFLILFSLVYPLGAQHKLYETFPVCQKQDTLRNYLKSFPAKESDDYFYLLHFSINACPRCEGVAGQFYDLLPPNLNKVILIETSSIQNLETYLKKNPEFRKRQCIIDSQQTMRQFVDHSRLKLAVPYFYKVNRINGEICSIIPILGLHLGQQTITDVLQAKTALDCRTVAVKTNIGGSNQWDYTFPVLTPNGAFDDWMSFNVLNNREIVLQGNTENAYHFFDLEGNYLRQLGDQPMELYHYVDSPHHHQLRKAVTQGIAKNIYLNILTDPSGDGYLISNSLPALELIYNPVSRDTDVYYDNVPNLIHVPASGKPRQYQKINFAIDSFLSSSHLEIWTCDSLFITLLSKGWPANGTDESDLNNPKLNPFREDFYEDAASFEIWTQHGSKGKFGKAPALFRKYKTGYAYSAAGIAQDRNFLLHVNYVSGDLTIYKKSNLLLGIPAYSFCIYPKKLKSTPLRDPAAFDNKLDYIFSYEDDFSTNRILDCMMHDGKIILLYRELHDLRIAVYSVQGKLLRTVHTPLHHASGIETIKLFQLNNRVHVAGLLKTKGTFRVGILQTTLVPGK